MSEEYVIFNGVSVVSDWPKKVEEAQKQTTYTIFGKEVARVKYGDELGSFSANHRPCRDCAVVKGQYHVRGCDVERCPVCDGQAFGCDCEYEHDK